MERIGATIVALLLAAMSGGFDPAHAATATVTIDQAAWSKCGLQYPATLQLARQSGRDDFVPWDEQHGIYGVGWLYSYRYVAQHARVAAGEKRP